MVSAELLAVLFLLWRSMSSCIELMFLETSALTGENVEEAFLKCARSILSKVDAGMYLRIDTSADRQTDNLVFLL